MTQETSTDYDVAQDTLWGVKGEGGIAEFLGRDVRQVRHLISKGALRGVKKLACRTIVGSKRQLREQFMNDEGRPCEGRPLDFLETPPAKQGDQNGQGDKYSHRSPHASTASRTRSDDPE